MKKKIALLLLFLCICSCGNNQNSSSVSENFYQSTSEETSSTITSSSMSQSTSEMTSSHVHTYGNTLVYDETYHWYEPTCGHSEAVNKTKHNFKSQVTPPTYEEKGYTTYSCTSCDYSYKDNETEALKHKYSTTLSYDEYTHWYACIDVGYENLKKDEQSHSFETKVTPSTYEEKGYTTYSCTSCDYSYKDNETEVLKHKYSSTLSYDEYTHWYACIDEGYENLKKDEQSHSFEEKVTPPTYEEKGYTTYSCTSCEYSYKADEVGLLKHSIVYNLDGGINSPDNPDSFTIEDNILLQSPKKDGCAFLGWYDNNGNLVESIGVGTNYDVELTAKWVNLFVINNNILVEMDSSMPVYEASIPSGVTTIEANAFDGCSLAMIMIPSSVTHIKEAAFDNCYNLEYIFYKGTIEDWCNIKFDNITALPMFYGEYFYMLNESNEWYEVTDIVIPKSVTKINQYQFFDFDNVKSITFEKDSKVSSIGNSAFESCVMLQAINDIPTSVTSIGRSAFMDCKSLVSLNIPSSVKTLEENTFNGCKSLVSVEILGVTKIGDLMFAECHSLVSVGLSPSLTSIGMQAFSECKSLKHIDIPSSVTSIGTYAFDDCTSLLTIKIPSSVQTMGTYVFYDCEKLVIYCQSSSAPSGWNANWNYYDCPVYWGKTSKDILEQDGVQYVVKNNKAVASCCLETVANMIIPSTVKINGTNYTVTSIGKGAFACRENIDSVILPNTITSIGEVGFWYSSLKSMVIPTSVTSIGFLALSGCWDLTIFCESLSQPSSWSDDWNDDSYVYWANQWKYDENGNPVPIN